MSLQDHCTGGRKSGQGGFFSWERSGGQPSRGSPWALRMTWAAARALALLLEQADQVAGGDADLGGGVGQAAAGSGPERPAGRRRPASSGRSRRPTWRRCRPAWGPPRAVNRHCRTVAGQAAGRGRSGPRRVAGDVHPQPLQGQALVVVLAAALVAVGGDAGGAMPQPHGRGHLVAVLPARGRRTCRCARRTGPAGPYRPTPDSRARSWPAGYGTARRHARASGR